MFLRITKLPVIISIVSISLITSVYSQELKGKLINQDKEPVSDATLLDIGTQQHAHSNQFGFFLLSNVRVNDSISIHRLGYEEKIWVVHREDFEKEREIVLNETGIQLDQLIVVPETNVLTKISRIDLNVNPVNSSQDVLRKVPGLIIGQHAGGGKAEQMFLRGFDLDHGTDINITVNGLPVNMVSHAHGQGYADLHFLIPETIEEMDYGKGPYYAEKGNFTNAGYVNFITKERIDQSEIKLEGGQFHSFRVVGLFNMMNDEDNRSAYIATEYLMSDGPFDSPQNFNRVNLFGHLAVPLKNSGTIKINSSYFQSKWNASGQIPQRAIDEGIITRFGSIDDTEGGNTNRFNLSMDLIKNIDANTSVLSQVYLTHYNFDLYSNFTFFLNDSINGDQIRQKEGRNLYGLNSKIVKNTTIAGHETNLIGGIGLRYDDVNDVELSHTANRYTTLDTLNLGDVDESNIFAFAEMEYHVKKWLINPGIRFDYFQFDYIDKTLDPYINQSESASRVSPKFNIVFTPNTHMQFFAKSGMGFHSNDTRVITNNLTRDILPKSVGYDLGVNLKPTKNIFLNVAYWYLHLDQEFVYVGDEAVVEPSGATERNGVDVSLRYQINSWIFADVDANYSHGRYTGEPEGENFIPLAPKLTSTGGLSFKHRTGISGSLRYRFIGDRPANEDNSVVSKGYFITDANVSYTRNNWQIGFSVENLFNQDWKETQFATKSRLQWETESVEEIHFIPGTPFFAKARIGVWF